MSPHRTPQRGIPTAEQVYASTESRYAVPATAHPVTKLSALVVNYSASYGSSQIAITSIMFSPSRVGLCQVGQPK